MDEELPNPPPLRSARSIQEFWVDFLLEEEFLADERFARSFLATCNPALNCHGVEDVAHSVTDKYGEADLVVQLLATGEDSSPERMALLIEDKINAGFQPNQAERYRLRGEAGKAAGRWKSYLTVLVAPADYISHGHRFDAAVSLERIKEWICPNDTKRRAFKLARLEAAITKKAATGVQIVDLEMTRFRTAYYCHLMEFNARHGTDLRMRSPAPTYEGDNWFILKSGVLPTWSHIRHMGIAGNIDLTFKSTDYNKASAIGPLLESGMQLIQTGRHHQHVTIRLSTPSISSFDDFDRDQDKVEAALLNAEALLLLFQRKRDKFQEILRPARAELTPVGLP